MIKKTVSVIIAFVLVLTMSTAAFATEEQRFVFDEAGILTYDELEELELKAAQTSEKYGFGVYIVTFENLGGHEAWEYNEMVYDELCEYYNAGEDVVILLLSMEERQYDIMAHGYGNVAFTDYGKDVMAERFLDDFSVNSWYWGFIDYLDTCDEFLELAENGEPFDIGSGNSGSSGGGKFFGVIIAVIVSCVIALLVCLVLKSQMKTAVRATEAHEYAKGLDLTGQYDRFSHKDIRRIYNPPQENNDGGTTVNSSGSSHKSGGF
ncbi:MAG: TPM domain-containing protein [Oscillospiraceae bacterium]|nr:TPM domain-containing protein [Oscillospiraceae bacterium]